MQTKPLFIGCITRRHFGIGVAALLAALKTLSRAEAQEKKPIKIGMATILGLELGKDARDGLALAVKSINAEGGILGRKIETVVIDETFSPEGAKNAITKLIDDEKVELLIGNVSSGNYLASLPVIADAQIISLISAAAASEITAKVKEDYDTYKYIFRLTINADRQARAMLDFVKNMVVGEMGYKKLAILADNSKWAQEVIKVVRANVGTMGAEVVAVEVITPDALDYATPLSRIRSSGAEFVVGVLTYAKSDVLAKQYYDSKFPLLYGGMDSQSMDDTFFKRVDGKNVGEITSIYGARIPITPKTIPYYEKFEAAYGRTPGYQAWTVENGLRIYKEAVERAGSFDTKKVIPELEKTRYEGVDGIVEFDEMHDAKDGEGRVGWLFGQWRPDGTRSVIYPKRLRSAEVFRPDWQK